MAKTDKRGGSKAAFTIVELLTVMSIIVILMGLVLPSLNLVRRYARGVKQKNQFHSIGIAMELFRAEEDGYPDSSWKDDNDEHYCGAMKLCEAMVGQDLLGFHPESIFRSDGTNSVGTPLYPTNLSDENIKSRMGPYLQLESADAHKLKDIYGIGETGPYIEEHFVLCDAYTRVKNRSTGKKIGMPILYYKANTSNAGNDANSTNFEEENIYNYDDNIELAGLGMPWMAGMLPALVEGIDTDGDDTIDMTGEEIFYESIRNKKLENRPRPYRADSYILLSAGFDGEYGTPDDVFNFED